MIDPVFFTATILCNSIGIGRLYLETGHGFGGRINYCQTQLVYIMYFILANLLNQYGHLQASNIKSIKSIAYNWTKYTEF